MELEAKVAKIRGLRQLAEEQSWRDVETNFAKLATTEQAADSGYTLGVHAATTYVLTGLVISKRFANLLGAVEMIERGLSERPNE